MKNKVLIKSLGCRLNQFEADYIKSSFRSLGYSETDKDADICIINTCTVTGKADKKSIQMIKKLKKENSNAKIIATGCLVQTNKDDLKDLGSVDLFIDNIDKLLITDIIKKKPVYERGSRVKYTVDRTRPFIKIQDGCDNICTYCKVKYARGKSRSEPLNSIVQTAENLAKEGYKEIVLTGVNIGDYRDRGRDLSVLLKELVKIRTLKRIRLTSIEPAYINDALLSILKHEKICKYFHVPLQSGSDKILKLMKRPYTALFYQEIITRLKALSTDVIIGTDIIVGFPDETDEDFYQTHDLLKENNIFNTHIFRYSPRQGTEAYSYSNSIHEKVKYNRYNILKDLACKGKEEFYAGLIGNTISVLIENKIHNNKYVTALSSNYIPVLLPAFKYKDKIYSIQSVKISKFTGGKIYAG
ncbi:MAG: tRNA (N(6)-L-threonylcarbamoyladenosine(37)-C(2))-methylthiotransferase MtaB [Spirochaetes bacterium]|nr:tRNA (N(6)-L-threonylcarbamoyladenosine(37)-C(2))-methylthiotransferase MtaB [Spirochaetota bacterium]